MPTLSTAHLPPPKSWDEFEDMCADLFELEWADRHTTRYGRQGQRQNGVDIYGSPGPQLNAGVQCKGKRAWPPKPLTIGEIDREVEEAKKFTPPLTEFTIVTVAQNDNKIQDHVRAITQRHQADSLFSVDVMGWDEFIRKFTRNDKLVEKHYGTFTLGSVKEKLDAIHTAIVTGQTELVGARPESVEHAPQEISQKLALWAPGIVEALERDLEHRYQRALQRLPFPGVAKKDEFAALAVDALEGSARAASEPLRRRILFRAARTAALRGNLEDAKRFADAAETLRGEESDLSARARILAAQEKVDEALRLLRDVTDPEARTTLLSILHQRRGADAALSWFLEEKIQVNDLSAAGINVLAHIHLDRQDVTAAIGALDIAAEAAFTAQPYLLFLRAALRLASIFAKTEQGLALHGYPIDVRAARPIVESSALALALERANEDLQRVLPSIIELDLSEARRILGALQTWCDLLHPHQQDTALARLRAHMAEPETALSRLQFAFAFDPEFDPRPIARFLERRKELGGFNDEQLRAALVMRIHGDDPRALADFLAEHRTGVELHFGRTAIVALEVQALAQANDAASAKLALDRGRPALDAELTTLLEAEVAKAAGSDPIAEQKKAYELTGNVNALRILVAELRQKNDHAALAAYAEKLYAETKDPRDAVVAANALVKAGDDANFLRLIAEHPFVTQQSPALLRQHAWTLLERGSLSQTKAIVDQLRTLKSGKHRDFQLEIELAIESGAWETLAIPLNDLLAKASEYSGLVLIRAAHLAQASGEGPLRELIETAVARAPDDPQVLIGAYTIVLEEGLDEHRPEVTRWFARAVDLSGDSGLIKQFELKELLAQQRYWSERTNTVSDAVTKGDLPLIVAAGALRTTLVDLLLRNLVQGCVQSDPRKRAAVPLFSGRRKPLPLGKVTRVAVDTSTLLTLAWLGLLPKALHAFPEIVLPASVLGELFDGRARSQKLQKALLRRARELQSAIAKGAIKVQRSHAALRDPLSRELGSEFVSLLRAAEAAAGFVVRPAPLHRLGGDMNADVSAFRERLVDLHSVLTTLTAEGLVEEAAETTARHYLELQDNGWGSSPPLEKDTPLFIDGLSLIYLQTVNLLGPLLRHFTNVWIDASAEEQMLTVLEHDSQTVLISKAIDDLRLSINKEWTAGRIAFGPRQHLSDDDENSASRSSTLAMLSDLMGAQLLLADDRALNKEAFATDRQGHRVPIGTTLDLLEELRQRELLNEEQFRSLRHRLRAAGAALMPVTVDEITVAAQRSKNRDSAEIRAIRESIGVARTTNLPRFPMEIAWFADTTLALHKAIVRVWAGEPDRVRAARLAELLLNMRLHPEEWQSLWDSPPPAEWARTVQEILIAHIAVPVELPDRAALDAYNEWLQAHVLAPLSEANPSVHRAVVARIQDLLLNAPFDEADDGKSG